MMIAAVRKITAVIDVVVSIYVQRGNAPISNDILQLLQRDKCIRSTLLAIVDIIKQA